MSFPPPPDYSRNEINRAGAILVDPRKSKSEKEAARQKVNEWRVCHGYPINTFQATLRGNVKRGIKDPNALVAQRLKRLPTIIDKLQREPSMQLSRMQDIGGLRAIVKSVSDVRTLEKIYTEPGRFPHILKNRKDYIATPKSSGYRGVHLIYEYRNTRASEYNGLLLELQLRTRLQHIWATAVETAGNLLDEGFKFSQGDSRLLDFFALASSAFAFVEKTPPVPTYKTLGKEETFAALAKIESDLTILDRLSGMAAAANIITRRTGSATGWYYHLIILDRKEMRVAIESYAKTDLKEASADLADAERAFADKPEIDAVLVAAGSIRQVKQAYPGFFLEIGDFVGQVRSIINTS